MAEKSGRFFKFASVLIAITLVLVMIEAKSFHRSSSASRRHDHPSQKDNWSSSNHKLQDTPNRDENQNNRDDRPETIPSVRRKRQSPYVRSSTLIDNVRDFSACKFTTQRDTDAERNPREIFQVHCDKNPKRISDKNKYYICQQVYEKLNVTFENGTSIWRDVNIGCIYSKDRLIGNPPSVDDFQQFNL